MEINDCFLEIKENYTCVFCLLSNTGDYYDIKYYDFTDEYFSFNDYGEDFKKEFVESLIPVPYELFQKLEQLMKDYIREFYQMLKDNSIGKYSSHKTGAAFTDGYNLYVPYEEVETGKWKIQYFKCAEDDIWPKFYMGVMEYCNFENCKKLKSGTLDLANKMFEDLIAKAREIASAYTKDVCPSNNHEKI